MEYVTYLSKSKIDMLYDQIVQSKRDIEIKGTLNLGLLSGSFSKKDTTPKNHYEKLEIIIMNMDKVGTVFDEEADFICGTMNMTWGVLKYTPEATFWVGEDYKNNCLAQVLLIGSSKNIIGASPKGDGIHYSPLAYFLEAYAKDLELQNHKKGVATLHRDNNIESIIETIKSHYGFNKEILSSRYKFIAKPLARSFYNFADDNKRNYIIASPIYVSLQ